MTIDYRAWRWRRRWRVRFEGVCGAIPGGWEILDFEGRGRTLEAACRNAEREERAAKRFRAPTIHIR